ncbi:MAG: TIGR03905 family TSCPD domain-containing protein [Clostridiales bacterium]|nr:TIGR03905 family TSCPD domain-containing protein [Clostridiales bacterium]
MNTYNTSGTCSRQITFDVENSIIKNVNFLGGCSGNLQGISKLVEGMNIDEAISKLKGIDCNGRGTSCPDQLSLALIKYKEEH